MQEKCELMISKESMVSEDKARVLGKIRLKSLLFDVSGVIGDVRGTVSWKIKVAMEEAGLDQNYGIGFFELAEAYSSGGWDALWKKYAVKDKDVGKYMRTWSSIPEYPAGSVRIYPEVPFVLNHLVEANINVCFLTRLTNENVENVLSELERRGFKGEIKVFNPQTEDERRSDSRFIERVLCKACTDTLSPKAYVGDELDRGPQLRIFDEDITLIGSTRGFASVRELKTLYYRWFDGRIDFQHFDKDTNAQKKGYCKVFDRIITNLNDLLDIVNMGGK